MAKRTTNVIPLAAVKPVQFGQALSERYLSYALSTIMARSLPDVRDGLKPVHRRLMHAMRLLRLDPNSAFKKSARVVGDVIGQYHPHGDQSIYDALVRLAQEFSVRYPLIEGQGNFGNIDGDNPAAMRYTEARLTAVAEALLGGIDENAVDFRPNYDGSTDEPIVLPGGFPNLLANGSAGIAVGMATSIPPHNAGELCDALLHLIPLTVRGRKEGVVGVWSWSGVFSTRSRMRESADALRGNDDEKETKKTHRLFLLSFFPRPIQLNPTQPNSQQVVSSRREAEELKELLAIAREYNIGLRCELARKAVAADGSSPDAAKRNAELAAYFTHARLQPAHLALALRSAMVLHYKLRCFASAAGFCRRLLELGGAPQKVVAQARQVLAACEQQDGGSPTNAIADLEYDGRNPFDLCSVTFTPIYRGSPFAEDPFSGARFQPSCEGQVSPVGGVSRIGAQATGMVSVGGGGGGGRGA